MNLRSPDCKQSLMRVFDIVTFNFLYQRQIYFNINNLAPCDILRECHSTECQVVLTSQILTQLQTLCSPPQQLLGRGGGEWPGGSRSSAAMLANWWGWYYCVGARPRLCKWRTWHNNWVLSWNATNRYFCAIGTVSDGLERHFKYWFSVEYDGARYVNSIWKGRLEPSPRLLPIYVWNLFNTVLCGVHSVCLAKNVSGGDYLYESVSGSWRPGEG